MSEFIVRNESIDVERIMGQIRRRIEEKRGEDYTEEQIRELANVKLDRFLKPESVRSNMVEYYQKRLKEKEDALRASPQPPPSFEFDPDIIYRSSRGVAGRLLFGFRRLVSPLLKLFFNPAPIVHALTIQQQINERQAEVISQMVRTQTEFIEIAALNYEVMNNLVEEMTRLSLEMKNHKMRVESVAGRLDFDERRARSLERVAQPRASGSGAAGRAPGDAPPHATDGAASPEPRRRRRRRGRRRPAGAAASESGTSTTGEAGGAATQTAEGPARPSGDSSAPEKSASAGPGGDSSTPAELASAGPGGDSNTPAELASAGPGGDSSPLGHGDSSTPAEPASGPSGDSSTPAVPVTSQPDTASPSADGQEPTDR